MSARSRVHPWFRDEPKRLEPPAEFMGYPWDGADSVPWADQKPFTYEDFLEGWKRLCDAALEPPLTREELERLNRQIWAEHLEWRRQWAKG